MNNELNESNTNQMVTIDKQQQDINKLRLNLSELSEKLLVSAGPYRESHSYLTHSALDHIKMCSDTIILD